MMRKGLMKGSGKPGYYNVVGKDPMVHRQSAMGIKQPQKMPKYPHQEAEFVRKYGTKMGEFKQKGHKIGVYNLFGYAELVKGGKLSLEERKQIANTIYQQIGAGRFKMMTGARDYVVTEKGLQFRIPKGKDGINLITIELNSKDLYDVTFYSMRKSGLSLIKKAENKDIYNDQLREIFTEKTGLYTSLGGKGGKNGIPPLPNKKLKNMDKIESKILVNPKTGKRYLFQIWKDKNTKHLWVQGEEIGTGKIVHTSFSFFKKPEEIDTAFANLQRGGKWPSKEYWDIDKFTMDVEPADTSVGIMDDTYTLYADRGKKKDIELVFGSRRMGELMDITSPYIKKRDAMLKWEKEEFERWKKENPVEYKRVYGNKKIR